jgi:hypothetical protein
LGQISAGIELLHKTTTIAGNELKNSWKFCEHTNNLALADQESFCEPEGSSGCYENQAAMLAGSRYLFFEG